jgi:hypothetical protein
MEREWMSAHTTSTEVPQQGEWPLATVGFGLVLLAAVLIVVGVGWWVTRGVGLARSASHMDRESWPLWVPWLIFPGAQVIYTVLLAILTHHGWLRALAAAITIVILTACIAALFALRSAKERGLFNVVALAGLLGANTWAATAVPIACDPVQFVREHLFDYIAVGAIVGVLWKLLYDQTRVVRTITLMSLLVLSVGSADFEAEGLGLRLLILAAGGAVVGLVAGRRKVEPIPP